MPHLVEMHKKHAKDGMVAMTVHLLTSEVKDPQADVLGLLKKLGAEGTNLYLDEPAEFWPDKLHFDNFPCVVVFNRQGKWVQFKDENLKYEEVDKVVLKFLQEK